MEVVSELDCFEPDCPIFGLLDIKQLKRIELNRSVRVYPAENNRQLDFE